MTSLRRAIEAQILAFRNQAFAFSERLRCPLLGTELTRYYCHVDHEPPLTFNVLVSQWLAKEKLTLLEIDISPSLDNQIVATMADKSQSESWQKFHQAHAKLRIISREANLSQKKLLNR